MDYDFHVSAKFSNPTYNYVFNRSLTEHFDVHLNGIPPFGLQLQPHLETNDIDIISIRLKSIPVIQPWTLAIPTVFSIVHMLQ